MYTKLDKYMVSVPLGFFAVFLPLLPLIYVCMLAVMIDSYTAWRLSVRLKKKGKSKGKIQSKHLSKIFDTMIKMLLLILLAHSVEVFVLIMFDKIYLANWVAAVFCAVQAISILENISSENGAKWATILQRVLINKASRHYDIDLNDEIESKEKE